ncbi:hypothetical protein [Acidilobus sp. 7A]|uniref:hypothetical protein n=1 Tax=Acidilobus sp. 7A TaxID=1577685 RepID=UPI000764DC5C|nr:hypothetical protein [Acidilobus sp. 7A]AMD30667.1 hypothetical protein SE86_04325 [Acidilobus sp. 7A]
MRSGLMAAALALMVGLALLSPLSLIKAAAQTTQGQQGGANATATSAEVLLNITQRAIAVAKAQGVNVTEAEELYSEALSYYRQGNYSQCIGVAIGIMKVLATQLKKARPAPMPQAIGVEAQLRAIEAFVSSNPALNSTEREQLISMVEQGLRYAAQGNASAAAQVLSQLKQQLSNLSINVSEYAKKAMIGRIAEHIAHAKHEAEQAWAFLQQANVSPSDEAEEVFGAIEGLLNRSAVNATPAQLVEMARTAEELESEAPELMPFPNASGRVMVVEAQAHVIRGINESIQAVQPLLQQLSGSENQTAERALNLLEEALNDTYTAVLLFARGNDTGSLVMLNQSIVLANKSLGLAGNLSSSSHGPARAVGHAIASADELVIKLDERLYAFISSQNIIGKVVELRAVLLYEVNSSAYIGIAKVVNLSSHHVVFVLVEITGSTKVTGNLTASRLPVGAVTLGLVEGRVQGLYLVEAYSVTLENATQGLFT